MCLDCPNSLCRQLVPCALCTMRTLQRAGTSLCFEQAVFSRYRHQLSSPIMSRQGSVAPVAALPALALAPTCTCAKSIKSCAYDADHLSKVILCSASQASHSPLPPPRPRTARSAASYSPVLSARCVDNVLLFDVGAPKSRLPSKVGPPALAATLQHRCCFAPQLPQLSL